MKKFLFLLVAATGMLFATSCSTDDVESGLKGNEAQIAFSLGLEDGIGTRAISDGKTANLLYWAIFDANNNLITTIAESNQGLLTKENAFATPKKEFVNVTLAKGQTYTAVFWAQYKGQNVADPYTVTAEQNGLMVAIDYTGANNDEYRDAFFAAKTFTVSGSASIDVELKRPFAQVNVGVYKTDWEAAVQSGIKVINSSATIKQAATGINLLDGSVSGAADVEYTLGAVPNEAQEVLKVDTDNDGVAEEYVWLSMSYILPNANPGDAKTTLDNIAFTFDPEQGEDIVLRTGLNAVPVQRNWRTNILGKLLTGDLTFNITIDPIYENDHNVMVPYATIYTNDDAHTFVGSYKTFAEAMAAVKDGEVIKLEGETTLDANANGHLFTVENKNIAIDLNGYGFVANIPDVTKNTSIFQVKPNSGLTIYGEGNVKVVSHKATNCLAAFISNEGGIVSIENGTWTMSALEYPDALIPTFVDNNSTLGESTLWIHGGTFTFHRNLFRNFANHKTEQAIMNILGGTFIGRESDHGAIWNQKPSSSAPANAGVINVQGGTFINVDIDDEFAGVVYANSNDELTSALANANTHTVMLGAGKYVPSLYPGDIPTRKSLTIIGTEGTQFAYTGSNYAGQFSLEGFDAITIRNCEILKRENVKDWGMVVFGASKNPNGVYTFENCTFNGVGTQGIYINETVSGATYNILNCTFNGDFGGEGAITIQNNSGVNVIINVMGNTFSSIPATSHKIFVKYAYNGWTLNTDLDSSDIYWNE